MTGDYLNNKVRSTSAFYGFEWDAGGERGDDHMSWSSREHGSIIDETAGEFDFIEAKEIIEELKKDKDINEFIKWEISSIDEWVSITACLTDDNIFE